jgi:HEAT repeat protein
MRRQLAAALLLLSTGCGGASKWTAQLESGDATERAAAARALSDMGPAARPAVPALARAVADPDPEVRRLAAYALRQIGPDARDAAPDLEKALADSVPAVKRAAAYALLAVSPDSAAPLPTLIEAIQLGDARAIVAVGQMGPAAREAIPSLVQAMGNRSTVVRVQAVQALARSDPSDKAAQAALARARNDPEERVRQAAASASPP